MAERKELDVEDIVDISDLPSNSHKSKEKSSLDGSYKKTKKEIKTIAKVKKAKKPSVGKRISSAIVNEDSKSVGEYIVWDVLIPAAKDLISDMVTGGIQMLLFGESNRTRNVKRNRGVSRVSYSKYWEDDDDDSRRKRTRRKTHVIDDLIFDTRQEAEEVLDYLVDIIDEYEVVSVADLYDMIGYTSEYTDNKWGWYSVSTGSIVRDRDGYLLKLPRPEVLD